MNSFIVLYDFKHGTVLFIKRQDFVLQCLFHFFQCICSLKREKQWKIAFLICKFDNEKIEATLGFSYIFIHVAQYNTYTSVYNILCSVNKQQNFCLVQKTRDGNILNISYIYISRSPSPSPSLSKLNEIKM